MSIRDDYTDEDEEPDAFEEVNEMTEDAAVEAEAPEAEETASEE